MRLVVIAGLLSLVALVGCQSDASKAKAMEGTWSWKPRTELPPDEVVDKGFPTPATEALELKPDGTYVYIEEIPGYDTTVADKPFRVAETWAEWRGKWSYAKGELTLDPSSNPDRWGAVHDEKHGWLLQTVHSDAARSFKPVALSGEVLKLHDLAIGGHDRTFHRATALPPRPTLAAR